MGKPLNIAVKDMLVTQAGPLAVVGPVAVISLSWHQVCRPQSVLVMDNASITKSEQLAQMCHERYV